MSVDASVISQIPDMAGDPVGAVQRGYTLRDVMNQEQLGELKLRSAKQGEADQQKAKDILSKQDISTPEGLMKASEALNRAGLTDKAMGLLKESQATRQSNLELDESKLKVLTASADVIGPAALQVQQTLKTQGPAMARAQYQQMIAQILPQLPQEFRQHIPSQPPADDAQFAQLLQGAVNNSTQARGIITNQLAQRKQDLAEKKEGFSEDIATRKETLAEQKAKQQKEEADQGIISEDSAQMAVDRILNGEQARDVLANFGRGKQGPQNIAKVQNLLAKTAKERNVSAQELTARMVEMKGLQKEQQTEASIAGKISYAEKEIGQIAPKVMELSSKVPRGAFVPWNRLKQMTEKQISDPNLKKLKAYLTTLSNSYDVLGGRGGTDVEKRAHNRELLDSADGPEALQAAVTAIQEEAALSGEAATESMHVDRSKLGGGGQTGAGGGGAAAANDPLGLRGK
jgi:hypothetical protein